MSFALEASLQQSGTYVNNDDSFGLSIAMSADGTRVIVGAINDEYNNIDTGFPNYGSSGRAYIFVRSAGSWILEASLQQPVEYANNSDSFGFSVAMSADGTRVVIGAYLDEYNNDANNYEASGRAYIFVRTGSSWALEASLQQPVTYVNSGDSFGVSVAMSADGNRVIVGAQGDEYNNYSGAPNPNYSSSGRAYIFARTGSSWTLEAELQQPSDYVNNSDQFGVSVAISADGTRVIVGAYIDEYNNIYTGANNYAGSGRAYIFARTGSSWALEASLQQPVDYADINDFFGVSVAISGDGTRVIVGAYLDEYSTYPSSGRAYIFMRTGSSWTLEASLQQPVNYIDISDQFGISIAMSADGTRVIVGAYQDEYNNDTNNYGSSGRAYIFVRTGTSWTLEAELQQPTDYVNSFDLFGVSVAMSADGTRVIIGAYRDEYNNDTDNYGQSGRAYIFSIPPPPPPPLFFRKIAASRETLLLQVTS